MLKDLKNIFLIPIASKRPFFQTRLLIRIMQLSRIQVIKLGYFGNNFKLDPEKFTDQSMYEQAQIDWSSRWRDFHFVRNLSKANSLFSSLGLAHGEYILVHEDKEREMKIKDEYLGNQYRIIRIEKKMGYHIFDYVNVIEAAAEIHCIESSFAHFIDSISEGPELLFLHTYARPDVKMMKSNQISYKRNWRKF
jgi:hypothetical protein